MRASSSELAVWRERINAREREHRAFGSIETELWRALVAEREHALDMEAHALDYEARVREMAADRREMPAVEGLAIAHRYARMAQRKEVFGT